MCVLEVYGLQGFGIKGKDNYGAVIEANSNLLSS